MSELLLPPHHPPTQSKIIKVLYFNSQSYHQKANDIHEMILDDSIDILLMTETWLYAQGDKACIDEMMLQGYVLQSFPWTGSRGGGITFIVRDTFCDSTSFKPLSFQSFKAIQLHISGRNLSISVVDYAISGISHVNTSSSHPNQFKRCFLWVDIQHWDRSLFLCCSQVLQCFPGRIWLRVQLTLSLLCHEEHLHFPFRSIDL